MNAVLLGRKRRIAFDGSSLSEGLLFANSPLYGPTLGVANGSRKSGIDDLAYSGAIGGQSFALSGSRWGGILGLAGTSGSTVDTWGVSTTSINTKLANSNAATAVAILRTDTTAVWGDVSGVALKNGGDGEHYPYSDGKIYSGPFCTARWVNAYTPTSPLSVPHMIAATSKVSGGAGRQQFYFNNELAATASRTDTPSIGTSLRIGGNGWWYFLGLWNRELSPEELTRLYSGEWKTYQSQRRIFSFPSAGGGGATLTADSGTYTLTGTAATLKADRKLAAGSGSYAVTGTDAALKVGRKLSADSGTYSVTGTAVNFLRGYALAAESGSYSVSGTDAALRVGRLLSAESGSYVLSGSAAVLQYQPAGSYSLTAESGAYTLTGTTATLKASRKLTADSGTYALTGTDVTLTRGFKITADSGTYTVTGSNVAFTRTYVLDADSGSYTLTGSDVGLTWSGAPVVEVPTNGGPSIYGKPVFREKQFRKEYEEQVKRIEDEKRLARILREDEEITVIMALMAA